MLIYCLGAFSLLLHRSLCLMQIEVTSAQTCSRIFLDACLPLRLSINSHQVISMRSFENTTLFAPVF